MEDNRGVPKTNHSIKRKRMAERSQSPSKQRSIVPSENIDDLLDLPEPSLTKGEPKLYVDVNIGAANGMERIVVYDGDSADELASNFCVKHGLN